VAGGVPEDLQHHGFPAVPSRQLGPEGKEWRVIENEGDRGVRIPVRKTPDAGDLDPGSTVPCHQRLRSPSAASLGEGAFGFVVRSLIRATASVTGAWHEKLSQT